MKGQCICSRLFQESVSIGATPPRSISVLLSSRASSANIDSEADRAPPAPGRRDRADSSPKSSRYLCNSSPSITVKSLSLPTIPNDVLWILSSLSCCNVSRRARSPCRTSSSSDAKRERISSYTSSISRTHIYHLQTAHSSFRGMSSRTETEPQSTWHNTQSKYRMVTLRTNEGQFPMSRHHQFPAFFRHADACLWSYIISDDKKADAVGPATVLYCVDLSLYTDGWIGLTGQSLHSHTYYLRRSKQFAE